MSTRALEAVLFREAKIRATNWTFIFWDLLYPLGYLLVFGLGMNASLGFTSELNGLDYNAFFLDRDNGIFYEMLTYPLSRSQYLVGKVLFNVGVALVQALLTVGLSGLLLGVQVRPSGLPLLVAATVIGTSAWFFFYAIFALRIRRNDTFNAVTSVFYFVFLFASSMFYPLEPLPSTFRFVASLNPITWHVDVLRYATIGVGDPRVIAIKAGGFVVFTLVAFWLAVRALERE